MVSTCARLVCTTPMDSVDGPKCSKPNLSINRTDTNTKNQVPSLKLSSSLPGGSRIRTSNETPKEAAVALARLRHDLELGVAVQRSAKKPQPPARSGAPKKVEVGVYLGLLLRPPRAAIPTVRCCRSRRRVRQRREAWRSHTRGFWRSLRTLCAHLHPRTRVSWRRACAIDCRIGLHICGICDNVIGDDACDHSR